MLDEKKCNERDSGRIDLLVIILAVLGAMENSDVEVGVLALEDVRGTGLDLGRAAHGASNSVVLQDNDVGVVLEGAALVLVGAVDHGGRRRSAVTGTKET